MRKNFALAALVAFATQGAQGSPRAHHVFGCWMFKGDHRWLAMASGEFTVAGRTYRIDDTVTLTDADRALFAQHGVPICVGFNIHSNFCLDVRSVTGASLNQAFQRCRGHEGKIAVTR